MLIVIYSAVIIGFSSLFNPFIVILLKAFLFFNIILIKSLNLLNTDFSKDLVKICFELNIY